MSQKPMRYCSRCILPDTRPNLVIGADGVCNACHSHGTKREIDWTAREAAFRAVAAHARTRSTGYDCLIPVSGGKDSTWQVVKCLEYGLKPLTVTWKPPGRTPIGQENLDNLISLGVDHIDYAISPKVERMFMLEGLKRHGSTAIPMHMAIFNIPTKIAVQFGIPLVIWGENSAFEYGGTEAEGTGFKLDNAWLARFGVTHGTTAADWVGDTLSQRDLTPYFAPSDREVDSANVLAVFLGYYFEWDPDATRRVAAAHGFKTESRGARTGLYDYADIDDDFISIHHWMKWHKFGFTRLYDNLSLEIRNGRITRAEAVETVRARGDETPHDDIAKLARFLEIPVSEFLVIAETFRNTAIWTRDKGVWKLRDFLIPDWHWARHEI
jgi:N-acetyl sugar amidotransferase